MLLCDAVATLPRVPQKHARENSGTQEIKGNFCQISQEHTRVVHL